MQDVVRTDIINKIEKVLEQENKAVVLVCGPHGMGKTIFLRQMHDYLRPIDNISVGYHRLESPGLEKCHIYLKILQDIIPQWLPKNGNVKKQDVKDTVRRFEEALREMAPALWKDALGFMTGWLGGNIENTARAFVKSCKKMSKKGDVSLSLEELLKENKEALITTYLRLLDAISKATLNGHKHVIILDQVERSSDTVRLFLFSLLTKLPDKFYIIYGLNDEIPQGLEFFKAMSKRFVPEGVRCEIPQFTVKDVEEWIRLIHGPQKTSPPHIKIKEVLQKTGGRPLFIFPWIKSDFTQTPTTKDCKELCRVYELLFKDCHPTAQELAKALSLLPEPLPGGLEDYASAFNLKATECKRHFGELAGINFFDEEFWFKH